MRHLAFGEIGKRIVAAVCVAALTPLSYAKPASGQAAPIPPPETTATVAVNRTLPKVDKPAAKLQFSANPTAQDIFRARIFEEPLLPFGGEPTATENTALAAALLAYA